MGSHCITADRGTVPLHQPTLSGQPHRQILYQKCWPGPTLRSGAQLQHLRQAPAKLSSAYRGRGSAPACRGHWQHYYTSGYGPEAGFETQLRYCSCASKAVGPAGGVSHGRSPLVGDGSISLRHDDTSTPTLPMLQLDSTLRRAVGFASVVSSRLIKGDVLSSATVSVVEAIR